MLSKSMIIALMSVLGGGVMALTPTHAGPSQATGSCAPSNTVNAQDFISSFQWMMGGDDSSRIGARTQAAIPKVDSATIVFVSDTTVCRAAASAYTMALQDTTVDRSVYMLQIGNRCVVLDPFKWAGQYTPAVTFDSTLSTVLARLMM